MSKKVFLTLFLSILSFIFLLPEDTYAQSWGYTPPSTYVRDATQGAQDRLNADIQKRLTEITGRQADGNYGGDGTAVSIYTRVLNKTNDVQAARDASYDAEQRLRPLVDTYMRAEDTAYILTNGKTTTEINANPQYVQAIRAIAESKRALETAQFEIEKQRGILSEQQIKQKEEQLSKPVEEVASGIIGNRDTILETQARSKKVAEGIYCLEDRNNDTFGIPEFSMTGCIGLGLYYGLLKPSSWVLWASGVAFNYSIDFTLNFGKFLKDNNISTPGGAIYLGWSAIRNLINVGFIFVLLYAGIATILGIGDYGVKKTVVKVVIAVLFINFSLFFTKALIDLSNLVALQFYTRVLDAAVAVNGSSGADTGSGATLSTDAGRTGTAADWDAGLSIGFINAIGLKSIWAGNIREVENESTDDISRGFGGITAGDLIIICLGGSAFILVTAFALFMATIRFLFRSIVLIFLMILSPFGFAGTALPVFKGPAGKWKSRLESNLIFAPAYMAVFYVVSLIVFGQNIGPDTSGANAGQELQGFAGLFQGDVSKTGVMFWFIMVIGLMVGTQLVADSFADKFGGGISKKAGDWAKRTFAGAPANRIVGGLSDALIKNTAVKAVLSRVPGGGALMSGIDKGRGLKLFGATAFKDKVKEKTERTTERAKLFKEAREVSRKINESDTDYDKRKTAVKARGMTAMSRYLGLEQTAAEKTGAKAPSEDTIKRSAEAGVVFRASRYVPVLGATLERRRRAVQKSRETAFKSGVKDQLEDKLKEAKKKLDEAKKEKDLYENSATFQAGHKDHQDTLSKQRELFASGARVDATNAAITGLAIGTIVDQNHLRRAQGALKTHSQAYLKAISDYEKADKAMVTLEEKIHKVDK